MDANKSPTPTAPSDGGAAGDVVAGDPVAHAPARATPFASPPGGAPAVGGLCLEGANQVRGREEGEGAVWWVCRAECAPARRRAPPPPLRTALCVGAGRPAHGAASALPPSTAEGCL